MSSAFTIKPITPAAKPAEEYPKPPAAPEAAAKLPPRLSEAVSEHRHAAASSSTALSPEALSPTDISYVTSLMGVLPAQKMEQILLKTGIPIPANLGPNVDTSA